MEYLYISSTQCSDIFPQNTWYDFEVELPKEIILKHKSELSLIFFDVSPSVQVDVDIFCDILEENCYQNSLAPFLSTISEVPYRSVVPFHVPIRLSSIKKLRFSIKTAFNHSVPTEAIEQANLILAVRKVK